MTCGIKCVVSGPQAALPTVPWFGKNYEQFSNYTILSKPEKWFNLAYHLEDTAFRLSEIKLFPSTKRELFLDIGTGFGYLPFFASHFNHCVIATNLYRPNLDHQMELFRHMKDILGVDVRSHETIPMQPIPINLFDVIKFDVVVAYLGWFHCTPRMLELAEWIFFLSDIAIHHTTDNARAYFHLNKCIGDKGATIDYVWSNNTMSVLEQKGVEFIYKHPGSTDIKIMNLKAFRS